MIDAFYIYIYIYLSIHLSIYPSIYLSIHLSIYLYTYIYIHRFFFDWLIDDWFFFFGASERLINLWLRVLRVLLVSTPSQGLKEFPLLQGVEPSTFQGVHPMPQTPIRDTLRIQTWQWKSPYQKNIYIYIYQLIHDFPSKTSICRGFSHLNLHWWRDFLIF